MSRLNSGIPPRALPAALLGLMLLTPVLTADAHLAILRQGKASRGVIEDGDFFGDRVVTGDFNGDGFDDLATAATREGYSPSPDDELGAVIISYGAEHGLTHVGADLLLSPTTTDSDGWILFGNGLAAGDFNGDGFDDLGVGAPRHNIGAETDAGIAYVFKGGPGGLEDMPSLVLDQTDGNGANEALDKFGATMVAGDFDADNRDELIVAAPGEDSDAGAIFRFEFASGASISLTDGDWIKQSTLGYTNDADDAFGIALAVGNFSGTANVDLAVGAPGEFVWGATNAGAVYVIEGGSIGLNTGSVDFLHQGELGFTPEENDRFGLSLAAGRFYNASGGYASLAVGLPGHSGYRGAVSTVAGGAFGFDLTSSQLHTQQSVGGNYEAGDSFGYALDGGDYDADGYDDVAVGTPYEHLISGGEQGDAGLVQILRGSASGPEGTLVYSYNADQLNDDIQANAYLGLSLAFGDFDNSGRANLAAGMPGDDPGGAVLILAPWRQLQRLDSQTSIVVNCQDEIVFSQKPFEIVPLASTTKVMTALVACERMDPQHPDYTDPSTIFEVKDWVIQNVEGSLFNFTSRERMSFIDMVRVMMAVSGNDAAYTIADYLTGGNNDWGGTYEDTTTEFVALMNEKAQQLGMTDTNFTTPPGRPFPDPGSTSTAYDMMILANAALQNPILAEIMRTTDFQIIRWFRILIQGQWVYVPALDNVGFGFLKSLRAEVNAANGLKPGQNAPADKTGLFSARRMQFPGGRVLAGAFGLPSSDPWSDYYDLAGDLLVLGFEQCASGGIVLPPPPPGELPIASSGPIPCSPGSLSVVSAQSFTDGRQILIDLGRWTEATPTASFNMRALRHTELQIGSGEAVDFGVNEFHGHHGFQLWNESAYTVDLELTATAPTGFSTILTLRPLESASIDSLENPGGNPLDGYTLSVRNLTSTGPAIVGITERGYTYDIQLGDGVTAPSTHTVQISRNGDILTENVSLNFTGQDTAPGNEIFMIMHADGAVVGVEDPDTPTVQAGVDGPIRVHPARPNPFRSRTHLEFELLLGGQLEILLYDVQGRLVHRLGGGRLASGTHREVWDGRDAGGVRLGSGTYFYRLRLDGQDAGGSRLVLLR